MLIFAGRSGFAFAVLAACLCGQTAHAQTSAAPYWTPGWLGFGGNLDAQSSNSQDSNANGIVAGFSTSNVGGFLSTRYNFQNGWFVGNERSSLGLGTSAFSQADAFGSFHSEGVQFGYNFNNAPVTVYAGFNTLKYDPGLATTFAPFDFTSVTAPGGYGAHAGVEFKPTSNFSMSVDVGISQRSTRFDSDSTARSLSGESQYDLVRTRR